MFQRQRISIQENSPKCPSQLCLLFPSFLSHQVKLYSALNNLFTYKYNSVCKIQQQPDASDYATGNIRNEHLTYIPQQ